MTVSSCSSSCRGAHECTAPREDGDTVSNTLTTWLSGRHVATICRPLERNDFPGLLRLGGSLRDRWMLFVLGLAPRRLGAVVARSRHFEPGALRTLPDANRIGLCRPSLRCVWGNLHRVFAPVASGDRRRVTRSLGPVRSGCIGPRRPDHSVRSSIGEARPGTSASFFIPTWAGTCGSRSATETASGDHGLPPSSLASSTNLSPLSRRAGAVPPSSS